MFVQPGFTSYNNWDLNNYSQFTGMAPVQLQQLQSAFNQQAAATGGRLSIDQFRNLYSGVNGLSWNFDNNAERALLQLGNNNNGGLTFDEFLAGNLLVQQNIAPVQRWSYVLNSYPVSRPGYLSQQEAQLLLGNMQQFYNFPLQESYFNTAWSQVNAGPDGYVPAQSFVQALVPLIPQGQIW